MDFDSIINDWANAQVLILRPSWNQAPKAAWHLETVVAEWTNVRDAVLALIGEHRPLVAAYALAAARMAKDRILLDLSSEVLQSKARVTVDEGSFRTSTDLGSLARKWANEARRNYGSSEQRD